MLNDFFEMTFYLAVKLHRTYIIYTSGLLILLNDY